MTDKSVLEKVAGAIALVSIAVAVTGTKGCQEDYEVGGQTSIETQAPTNTQTVVTTATLTPEGTDAPVAGTATVSPTTTNDPNINDSGVEKSEDTGLLEELSVLGEEDDAPEPAAVGGGGSQQSSGNWLGKGFDGSHGGVGEWVDSDGDGFSDSREEGSGSDEHDANSVPTDVERGQLESRIRQLDQDMDGLLNEDETNRGTNPNLSDSDGDGRSDGAEVLSSSNPLDATAIYADTDNDGLSDSFEKGRGLNPASNDSDSDGLRDDLELVVGSNPTKVDSDGDGISDGREYDLNSDPLLAHPDRAAN
ncbi:MAG: hypothetical protein RIS36_1619 [Pseudomonadota bacterium]|jgi:hypothetical protein